MSHITYATKVTELGQTPIAWPSPALLMIPFRTRCVFYCLPWPEGLGHKRKESSRHIPQAFHFQQKRHTVYTNIVQTHTCLYMSGVLGLYSWVLWAFRCHEDLFPIYNMVSRAQPWWSLFSPTIGNVGAKQWGIIQKERWRRSSKQAPANPRGPKNLWVLQRAHREVLVLHCKHFSFSLSKWLDTRAGVPGSGTCVVYTVRHLSVTCASSVTMVFQ